MTSTTHSLLICIDDTDDIGTKGTGEIAQEIALLLSEGQLSRCAFVTRHQLYVHPDIPYTSHNSAMCFQVRTRFTLLQAKAIAITHLTQQMASASDPGLALLDLHNDYDEAALIEFGLAAKKMVKTKAQAYQLAQQAGVDLSEHGGSGDGVIGAIAGIGLRLFGDDGRVKGQLLSKQSGQIYSAAQLIEMTGADRVIDLQDNVVGLSELIMVTGNLKAVFRQHQNSILVTPKAGQWINADKQQLKSY
ncbi:DNA-binding protein [Shewanella waksmanii]|uniref:DNA-binding protein n=1 Tax=Shewanella waksmanii TaxID=213783 RepID=UPI003734C620